ncbi:MAG: glycine cleavage system protein GcvH [Candidatus Latescibacteria bacterium]|nr:glycine cleavage system protein GcvH [Candidatus Latescibacterota bacterium]
MLIPDDLRYTTEHEWVRLDGDIATVGITDYAQEQLGDIVFVELPAAGTPVESMRIFGAVEAVKTVADLFSPVTGAVIAVNEQLEAHPEYVNTDPYETGWMIKIRVTTASEFDGLLTAQAYQKLIGA